MVRAQLELRGIRDPAILKAFGMVPREEFVLPRFRHRAYDDLEIPIGHGQTLDRPYEDAFMIRALALSATDKVLEIGTGSGYLTAIMSKIAKEVYTIEIVADLALEAEKHLAKLGYENAHVKAGDGYLGWPEHTPFDAIILTASPPHIPQPLVQQLADGGRLLLPLGGKERFQELILYIKRSGRLEEVRRLAPTTFVPMKGKILEGK